jgi:hypothetical protein
MNLDIYREAVNWFKAASLYCLQVADFFRPFAGFSQVVEIYEKNNKQLLQLYNNFKLVPYEATGHEIDDNGMYKFTTVSEIGIEHDNFGLYYADYIKTDPINEKRTTDDKQKAFVYDIFVTWFNPINEILFISEIIPDKAKPYWSELPAKPIEKLNINDFLK